METVRRILVHVCKDRAAPNRAHFLQSVTGQFSDGADEAKVNWSLETNQFVLSKGQKTGSVLLKRPAFCPIKHLSVSEAAAIPLDIQQRGVDVGVAVLLQSADQRVLLTRRSLNLRVFPNIWVPPGGHMEPDETVTNHRSVSIQSNPIHTVSVSVCVCVCVCVCVAPGCRPQGVARGNGRSPGIRGRLSNDTGTVGGPPLRHHVVSYVLVLSPLTHLQLQATLRPSPAEVSACVWVDAPLGGAIVSSVDGEEGEVRGDDLPSSVSAWEVTAGGALSVSMLPLSVLLSRAPVSGPDVERVSTGTKFALELWLKSLETCDLGVPGLTCDH
ncbi:m7GpppN-mRNA hydrolase NUDT17 isoform X1 [Genypterus blacodes]|uniref:m7GpppN-mRNA hydrolase NUDT17 isoform X1 n=1 Tax=Genypterus blacodes TaxID=154954 RepID=UPI003F7725B2